MKKVSALVLALVLLFALAACGGKAASVASTAAVYETVVDKAAGTVTIPCEVNGKYFTESTRHGIVYAGGSNGEKAVLRGLTDEKAFYEALIEIGAVAGNNLTMDDMAAAGSAEGKPVEGDAMEVTVKWDDKEMPFADIIVASDPRPMDIRFGGNLEAAKEKNTGCILCLDSCAVGITSNAAYPTGTTQNDEVQFNGNKDVLPADGTVVYVTFKVAG